MAEDRGRGGGSSDAATKKGNGDVGAGGSGDGDARGRRWGGVPGTGRGIEASAVAVERQSPLWAVLVVGRWSTKKK
jgi:hypothetical protein